MPDIVMNARVLTKAGGGVRRYAAEIYERLRPRVQPLAPRRMNRDALGHAWEQLVLPRLVGRSVLWSPANSGPVRIRRQVVTIHDVATLDHPEWFNPRFVSWYRWLLPRLIRNVACVIAVSDHARQRILDVAPVPESKVAVIPNAVDDGFRPQPADFISSVARRYGIATPHYVLSLSTLEPRKNLARVLAAWRQCEGALPEDVRLVLAGSVGRRRIFRDSGIGDPPRRVTMIGQVEDRDLSALYSGALAFVYPSLYEGFGLPPLEAMACGCPVLASNVTALPEVCGEAAVLVDPADTGAIADGLRRLVEDAALRSCLKARGLVRAGEYSWDRTATSVLAALEGAAEGTRG